MKLIATSDTHFVIPCNIIPEGDVFIHAGDLLYGSGEKEWYDNIEWIAALSHKTKLYTPGNHDHYVWNNPQRAIKELNDRGITLLGYPGNPVAEVDGIRFVGIPFVTGLMGWSFNATESFIQNYVEDVYKNTEKIDIVVAHSPPYGIMDYGYGVMYFNSLLEKYKPELFICGHVHEGYGIFDYGHGHVINVSMCDERYNIKNAPMIIDI